MCGILMVYGPKPETVLKKWIKNLVHRGPDNTDFFVEGDIGLAFTRLSINDQSALGNQPLRFGDYVSMMNAEIYNYMKLKKEYQIDTQGYSDSHVVTPLFAELGVDVLDVLDGFFSGVIFNKKTRRLYVIRDYIGKKGLFLARSGDFNVITSELKAIPKIDQFSIVPKGLSEIDLKTWTIKHLRNHEEQLNSAEQSSLPQLLDQAVTKRIPPNSSPFGVFLSGGLDSSILAAITNKKSAAAVYYILGQKTASTDFEPANRVADHLKIKNVKIIPLPEKDEVPNLIERLVWITESYNPSIISNGIVSYLLSLAAKQDGLKVILSGEGADELFGGYHYCEEADDWRKIRQKLIDDMHFTELRRLDLTCMSNSIEARFPYLDRSIYLFSSNLDYSDVFRLRHGALVNKYILRISYQDLLPDDIVWRKKTSSDVGSGIRKLVVEYLKSEYGDEKKGLKKIWESKFNRNPDDPFFHSYPSFDAVIQNRGISHR